MVNRRASRTALLPGLSSALEISCCILIRVLVQLPLVLQANWLASSLDCIFLLLKMVQIVVSKACAITGVTLMPLKSSLSVDRKIDFRERRNIPFLPQFVTSRKQSKMGRLQDGAKFAVSGHVMSARKEFEKWSAQQFQTYMTY